MRARWFSGIVLGTLAVSTSIFGVSYAATPPVVPADFGCFLEGTFRADPAMTLASYEAVKPIESAEARRALTEMFSSTVHQWQCTKFRAFLYAGRAEPYPATHGWASAEFKRTGDDSAQVVIRDGDYTETLHITVEGRCYRTPASDEEYFVYYCPDPSVSNSLPSAPNP